MHNLLTYFIILTKRENYVNIERADERMDIKDICNAGGDILNAVADAINRNDYTGLSDKVSNTVNQVVEQVKEEVQKEVQKNSFHTQNQTIKKPHNDNRYGNYRPYEPPKQEIVPIQNIINQKPVGRISGVIQLVSGIFFTSGFGIAALVMLILLASMGNAVFLILTVIFGAITFGSITNIVGGSKKIGLVNRFRHYARMIGNRSYIAIDDLAKMTGRTKKKILKDLKLMTQKRMFLQGRLDAGETTFMLTDEAYQQYQQAEASRRNRELQEILQKKQKSEPQRQETQQQSSQNKTTYNSEVEKILADGNAYIRTVRECNDLIPNEEVSNKLYKLEAIMKRIFEQVEKHPESAEDLHKLMDYYLPTTIKLLNAYVDLDKQEIAGANISATKKEIEDVLDVINVAFEKLLDSMFEDTAWDISSDISVMKTMMAQEGLTENKDFKL